MVKPRMGWAVVFLPLYTGPFILCNSFLFWPLRPTGHETLFCNSLFRIEFLFIYFLIDIAFLLQDVIETTELTEKLKLQKPTGSKS